MFVSAEEPKGSPEGLFVCSVVGRVLYGPSGSGHTTAARGIGSLLLTLLNLLLVMD